MRHAAATASGAEGCLVVCVPRWRQRSQPGRSAGTSGCRQGTTRSGRRACGIAAAPHPGPGVRHRNSRGTGGGLPGTGHIARREGGRRRRMARRPFVGNAGSTRLRRRPPRKRGRRPWRDRCSARENVRGRGTVRSGPMRRTAGRPGGQARAPVSPAMGGSTAGNGWEASPRGGNRSRRCRVAQRRPDRWPRGHACRNDPHDIGAGETTDAAGAVPGAPRIAKISS